MTNQIPYPPTEAHLLDLERAPQTPHPLEMLDEEAEEDPMQKEVSGLVRD